MEADFSGYASKANVLCDDGRTILPNALKAPAGKKSVPLLWQHLRDGIDNVLGHAILENRPDGLYMYGKFNDTPSGRAAKEVVKNGDIDSMSVFAKKLVHKGADVISGIVTEVSLCVDGANEGATIQNVTIAHANGDLFVESEDEAIIFNGHNITLAHASTDEQESEVADEEKKKSLNDIIESMNEEQQEAYFFSIEEALKTVPTEESDDDSDEDEELSDETAQSSTDEETDETLQHSSKEETMEHSVFNKDKQGDTLEHANRRITPDQVRNILSDAQRLGSLKDSFLSHAATYGFGEDIDTLFPDAKTLSAQPELLSRRMEWVSEVLDGAKHSPFARVKTIVADITAEEARARGYVKGNLKKDEIVKLLKRKTDPTTIYKKQKLDRDDVIDITDLDVIAWLKWEMRLMLDEELARAILLGDGRSASSEDKIDEERIRPIATDNDMYAIKVTMPSNASVENKIEAIIRARGDYRGSGTPVMFTSRGFLTDIRLVKDKVGRRIYGTVSEIAADFEVSKIVDVDIMSEYPGIEAVIVNMRDYTIGADKGGSVTFFDDFDIDFNQLKYLLETRVSGALTKPASALVLLKELGISVTPQQPTFDPLTNTITIPTQAGVIYSIEGVPVTGTEVISSDTQVDATADEGYTIPSGTVSHWIFTYQDNG